MRTADELAKAFLHEGWADGDDGYLNRNVSYDEAAMIRAALTDLATLRRERDEARAQVAALRDALDDEFPADVGTGYRAHTPKGISRVLDNTAAAAQEYEARIRADERAKVEAAGRESFVDVVFDGPPSHESGRFVECEGPAGNSIRAGEWIDRGNGLWALRIGVPAQPSRERVRELVLAIMYAHGYEGDDLKHHVAALATLLNECCGEASDE